ncbi:MAG: hypothetical protein K2W96_25070, partial [Gemmataceae bacterium]|nr:hypothetical protein [Gemmataceae bacterium]
MRKRIAFVVLAVLVVGFAPAPFLARKKGPDSSLSPFGLWEVVETSAPAPKGKKAAAARMLTEITAETWTFQTRRGETMSRSTPYAFKLDQAGDLRTFDLTRRGSVGVPQVLGIYRVEGDELRIAYRFLGDRPMSFDAAGAGPASTRAVLMRLRR